MPIPIPMQMTMSRYGCHDNTTRYSASLMRSEVHLTVDDVDSDSDTAAFILMSCSDADVDATRTPFIT